MAEAKVTISLPDRITLGVWHVYDSGRQAYIERQREAGRTAAYIVQQYFGVLALVAKGLVHIRGIPELEAVLAEKDQENTTLAVIGYLAKEVGDRIEAGYSAPLPWLKGSSDTSMTAPETNQAESPAPAN